MKLGKAPATHDARDLKFAAYRTSLATLPTLPHEFGHEASVPEWGMLGNDAAGDCVFAGAAHEHMLWNAARGWAAPWTEACALMDYSAVTGYDPNDPVTDQGTNVRLVLNYRRKTGVIDANGLRHKIAAYVALEPGHVRHVEEAAYLFEAVGIGIQFPDTAMDQFNAGKPWTVKRGAKIDGGHYVPIVGIRDGHLLCVTWGRLQAMSLHFFARYCDEAFAMLSLDMLANGVSPDGFDLAALRADLAAVAT